MAKPVRKKTRTRRSPKFERTEVTWESEYVTRKLLMDLVERIVNVELRLAQLEKRR